MTVFFFGGGEGGGAKCSDIPIFMVCAGMMRRVAKIDV